MTKGVRTIFFRSGVANSVRRKNSSDPFCGFSLLEVILALAILAGAFAALGEVMRLADRNAQQARDTTEAQLLANSVIDELLAGARGLGNAKGSFPLSADPAWVYTISVEPSDYVELVSVRVSVSQDMPAELNPARCDLVRWLPNPDYFPAGSEDASGGAR